MIILIIFSIHNMNSLFLIFSYILIFLFQHNLDHIQILSKKWLKVCQEALLSLFNKLNQNQNTNLVTMEDLIRNLGIDHDLIHFNCDNQEFY